MRRATVALSLASALLSSACVNGLNFKVDKRLSITAPHEDDTVSLPFTLSWTMRDLEADRQFGIFVDQSPLPPGKNLKELRHEDATCEAACTLPEYLALRGVYTTTNTDLAIKAFPVGNDDKKTHRITVVLLDSQGTRVGESAWNVDFRVRDKETLP
jgi:hypothetical protein